MKIDYILFVLFLSQDHVHNTSVLLKDVCWEPNKLGAEETKTVKNEDG